MAEANQNPEQSSRDQIDRSLVQAGWIDQSTKKIDLIARRGIAIKHFQTDIRPADYALFVDKKAVGIEAGLNSFRELLAGLAKAI